MLPAPFPTVPSRISKPFCGVLACLSTLFATCLGPARGAEPGASEAGYTSGVKPLLAQRCYPCHGALKQKAQLRLDTVAAMRRGGKTGPAFEPGAPTRSLLWLRAASADPEERMPPEHEGERFTSAQLEILSAWITQGAPAPDPDLPEPDPQQHWAFRPVARPAIPPTRDPTLSRNPIDAFLERARERRGIRAQPEAPRLTQVRRLYLDLVGLPPTVEELERDSSDPAPDAYERLVGRLLADPRHSERWARHWMDIWRYSDPFGLGDQLRNSQRHLWHWRDWIVEALDADLPYDEMLRLMLAADETHPHDLERLRATGFLARNYFLFNRHQWLDDTVEHVGKAFLGLTLNCAKCHDHKYDPIPQVDYYRLRAFFEPYHARLDVLPGEPDLTRDGLPRAFDRDLDPPTYRFVRGQENRPDLTTRIQPGVPDILAFAPLLIRPVSLPVDAYEPERRPWVLEAHHLAAQRRVEAARTERNRLAARHPAPASPPSETPECLPESGPAQDLALAELALQVAEAERRSVEARSQALRDRWNSANQNPASSHAEAVAAERAVAVARATRAAALAGQKHAHAETPQRETAAQELAKARETLEKARLAVRAPVTGQEALTPLPGAAWTPTRFADSTKDDPSQEFPRSSTGRRTALASWITDPRQPLTARVAVNHVWNRHFSTPLVPSLFDFGRKNPTPLHAELLDWLASGFVASGWSLKHLHRCIVTSAAYRMDSSQRDAADRLALDPDNTLWWRRPPIRLEAQVIRDAILIHAGRLDLTRGGPPVPPAEQDQSRRRSLYFMHSHNDRNPWLATFDDALVKECYRREQSIVPQQALALLNSRLVLDAAPAIAQHVADAALRLSPEMRSNSDATFVQTAFLTLLGYRPAAAELDAAQSALRAWRTAPPQTDPTTPGVAHAADPAHSQLVAVLLNHHDFVTLR
ncbi:MAG: PSD1 domain-containing protein [Verrucomicrobiales bacterium]|nr:PSD1 domain-containing protein [Verrucomicrobiales bacterium]